MNCDRWLRATGPILVSFLANFSCGENPTPAGCPDENQIGGACAGVPAAPVCDGDLCVAGVPCTNTLDVYDDAALEAAIATADAGTCIALAPGSYGTANLPGGVSLLGRSASSVSVAGVTLGPGEGAVLRGVAVGSGGLVVNGATAAMIESVRISGGTNDGIEARAGSSLSVITSTIEGAHRYGLSAVEGTDISIERTVFTANFGAGIWAECSSGCNCPVAPVLWVQSSILRGNFLLGMGLIGVSASLHEVDIVDTTGDPAQFYRDGAGLAVGSCSHLDAKTMRVQRSNAYGVLIEASDALLGGPGEGEGIEVTENTVGVWVRDIAESQTVTLENGRIHANDGVGVGVSGASRSFIICKSEVTGTSSAKLSVYRDGVIDAKPEDVGDGLAWLDGSRVDINGLKLSGNARASILIDGDAGGSLANVTLEGSDAQKGILQQNYTGVSSPDTLGNTPPLTVDTDERYAVPAAPTAP